MAQISTSQGIESAHRPLRLHVGCGPHILAGWVNIDLKELPGVDLVADVTTGLPFANVEAVYAEHFLEHLTVVEALAFLRETHRVLASDGWLRLSTPNLDWVWSTQYRLDGDRAERELMAMHLNRGFYGWQHRFLWNRELLSEALHALGFRDVAWCRYGESERTFFRGIEGHERYLDDEALPHVLIVEGRKGAPQPERLAALDCRLWQEFVGNLQG